MNPSMTMTVSQAGDLKYVARTSSGMEIIAEPTTMLGGSGTFPNPLEYFLASLGTCATIKIHLDLSRMGTTPDSIEVQIEYFRNPTPPDILTDIHLLFTLTGKPDMEKVTEAITEVMDCYCPVAVMVIRATHLTWEYRIVEKTEMCRSYK